MGLGALFPLPPMAVFRLFYGLKAVFFRPFYRNPCRLRAVIPLGICDFRIGIPEIPEAPCCLVTVDGGLLALEPGMNRAPLTWPGQFPPWRIMVVSRDFAFLGDYLLSPRAIVFPYGALNCPFLVDTVSVFVCQDFIKHTGCTPVVRGCPL